MFETMTYEKILSGMLGRVTSDVDKREGSLIYDALAPCAYELAQTYYNLNNFIDLVMGDTAVGEYLDRVVADFGIGRKPATYAVRKIETAAAVNIGTRWGLNSTTYKIKELLSPNIYSAVCEQSGEIGNIFSGVLENIDNVSGVTATLTDIISTGSDEETDDNLRTRFYTQVRTPSTSGNADSYKKWALEVPNVGDAKVFPLWQGAGTVKVLVVDSNMEIDDSLPATVASHIEMVRPIGAVVTVTSPISTTVNINAKITLDGSQTLSAVQASFAGAIGDYLKGLVFNATSVSYAKIGSLLLATDGVKDYTLLTVNGETSNIVIEENGIPTEGTMTLMEEVK